jgi:hypothetical protein
MPQLEKLARLAGARFVLRELAHPRAIAGGQSLHLALKWANVGVGKLHRPYVLRFSLLDAAGRTALSVDARSDPREWLPGDHEFTESWSLPATLSAGQYDLAVALVVPDGSARPFRLAIDAPEKDGRYLVSQVRVE